MRPRHTAWLIPVASFAGAIVLGLRSCDSDTAFAFATLLCAVTGVLAGGIRFIHHGRRADNVGELVTAAFLALVLAVPVAFVSWVVMIVVAALHCGNFELSVDLLRLRSS